MLSTSEKIANSSSDQQKKQSSESMQDPPQPQFSRLFSTRSDDQDDLEIKPIEQVPLLRQSSTQFQNLRQQSSNDDLYVSLLKQPSNIFNNSYDVNNYNQRLFRAQSQSQQFIPFKQLEQNKNFFQDQRKFEALNQRQISLEPTILEVTAGSNHQGIANQALLPEVRIQTRKQCKSKTQKEEELEKQTPSKGSNNQQEFHKQTDPKSSRATQSKQIRPIQTKSRTGHAGQKIIGKQEEKFEKSVKIDENSQSQPPSSQLGIKPCICSKTYCLQMYCQCFHNGRFCQPECSCTECKNNQQNQKDRETAISHIKSKAKRVKKSEDNIFDTKKIDGCKCKQTHCLKKYCECFIRGQKCTDRCDCENCENGQEEYIHEKMLAEKPKNIRNRISEDSILEKKLDKKRK